MQRVVAASASAGPAADFISWLEDVNARRGTSWRQFAAEASVSASALIALRTGKVARPSMETCYRIAHHLGIEPHYVLRRGGYDVPAQRSVDLEDPELDVMFHQLMELTAEEREPVKEFVHYALAKAAAKRSSARRVGARSPPSRRT
jgi:transcriptional regulator with XRE-family HTH domain